MRCFGHSRYVSYNQTASSASKWYALVPQAIIFAALSVSEFRKTGWSGMWRPLSFLAVIPLTIYLLVYAPWFAGGHSILEWLTLQKDAALVLSRLTPEFFGTPELAQLSRPHTWFLRFVGTAFPAGSNAYVVIMNNLPVWIFMLPAVGYMSYIGLKEKDQAKLLLSGSFVAMYASFLLVGRPMYLYSSVPLLPLGFLAIGYASERLLGRLAYVFLAAAALWSLFLYPLAVGAEVPLGLYQFIVALFS